MNQPSRVHSASVAQMLATGLNVVIEIQSFSLKISLTRYKDATRCLYVILVDMIQESIFKFSQLLTTAFLGNIRSARACTIEVRNLLVSPIQESAILEWRAPPHWQQPWRPFDSIQVRSPPIVPKTSGSWWRNFTFSEPFLMWSECLYFFCTLISDATASTFFLKQPPDRPVCPKSTKYFHNVPWR